MDQPRRVSKLIHKEQVVLYGEVYAALGKLARQKGMSDAPHDIARLLFNTWEWLSLNSCPREDLPQLFDLIVTRLNQQRSELWPDEPSR